MGAPIPLDQVERLKQRSDSINSLYAQERKGYCRSVFIHVDSRSKEQRIDIFFYHYMKSARGERLAKKLQSKMAQKYAKHQPARGFSGEVKERDLYVLRRTNPAGVFIEIGNIQNDMDM
ncbi:N-acetylmuramoyl-L-alanine amidase, partial [Salmonella enterica subsp. enterica serovar Mbandaka]|nr:N-acetylmuramoyl-L-alanine amidase [Salmonella enterica subsp. enterica serovar Mbandaka]